MTIYLMPIDAFILFFFWGICGLILASEDGSLTSFSRIPVGLTSGWAIYYALWLLSQWSPGPSGYPWQRVMLDGLIGLTAIWRTVVVLIALKRNSGSLFALRSFGGHIKQQ